MTKRAQMCLYAVASIVIVVAYALTSGKMFARRAGAFRTFVFMGVFPFAVLSAIRHWLSASEHGIAANLYEMECGGANLACGVAALVAACINAEPSAYATSFLMYGLYLAIAGVMCGLARRPWPVVYLGFPAVVFFMTSAAILAYLS